MWRLVAFPFLVILTVSRWSIYQPWWYRADGCDNYQADFFLIIISPDIIRLIILIIISPDIIRLSPSILLPCLSFRDSSVSILIFCRQVDSTVFAYYPISLIEGTKAILKYFWVFYAGNPHCHCFFASKASLCIVWVFFRRVHLLICWYFWRSWQDSRKSMKSFKAEHMCNLLLLPLPSQNVRKHIALILIFIVCKILKKQNILG